VRNSRCAAAWLATLELNSPNAWDSLFPRDDVAGLRLRLTPEVCSATSASVKVPIVREALFGG